MYQLIADSGSTKADWIILSEDGVVMDKIVTMGFNPYFQSADFIYSKLLTPFEKAKVPITKITHVHYYGAGCSAEDKNIIVKNGLAKIFTNATINIHHDLEASARATLGFEDGIACILGTGSNSCTWIDGKVEKNIPSHGYVFGDEGSGAYQGIKLLKLVLENKLSEDINSEFYRTYNLTKEEILNQTYKGKDPNVFLSSFAKFLQDKTHDSQLRNIIKEGFQKFFKYRVIPYKNYSTFQLGFVGSIAFSYKDILTETADKYGCKINAIVKCPIDGLIDYHAAAIDKQSNIKI